MEIGRSLSEIDDKVKTECNIARVNVSNQRNGQSLKDKALCDKTRIVNL